MEVASRVRPLRDFFLALFFLYLGTTLNLTGSGAVILPAIVFSVFVLVGNPVIVLSIMGFLGYRRRTSFLASVTVAQISEFSLIIMAMGLTLGHVGDSDMSTVVLVGIITMTASTYLILNSEKIFERIKNLLLVFERNSTGEPKLNLTGQYKDHVVLFGIHRTGQVLANYFEKAKMPFVSVDFNPEFHPVVFGDMGDPEILDALSLEKAKLIISTVPTLDDNEKLLEYVRNKKIATKVITSAKTKSDAEVLKKLGADMVVVPEVVAGVYLRGLLKRKLEAKKPL
ncbi:MAG: sodium/hydrogen exchanger [uncultured bacterium]|nr:MAG: sodium/hydrogen exchanger [uncultured bacterium]